MGGKQHSQGSPAVSLRAIPLTPSSHGSPAVRDKVQQGYSQNVPPVGDPAVVLTPYTKRTPRVIPVTQGSPASISRPPPQSPGSLSPSSPTYKRTFSFTEALFLEETLSLKSESRHTSVSHSDDPRERIPSITEHPRVFQNNVWEVNV